jgi:uncharacterized ion transporter superfamily protein YfcC
MQNAAKHLHEEKDEENKKEKKKEKNAENNRESLGQRQVVLVHKLQMIVATWRNLKFTRTILASLNY